MGRNGPMTAEIETATFHKIQQRSHAAIDDMAIYLQVSGVKCEEKMGRMNYQSDSILARGLTILHS